MFIILKHFFVILFETQNIWQEKKQNDISSMFKTLLALKAVQNLAMKFVFCVTF